MIRGKKVRDVVDSTKGNEKLKKNGQKIKAKANARSNLSQQPEPKPKPKTKNEQKAKITSRREKQTRKNTAKLRKEDKRVLMMEITDDMPRKEVERILAFKAEQEAAARKEAAREEARRKKEEKHLAECLEAKEQAVIPSAEEMRSIFAEAFRAELVKNTVKVYDPHFMHMSGLDPRLLEDIYYSPNGTRDDYIPSWDFFVKILARHIFTSNKELHLHRTYAPNQKKKSKKKQISTILAEEILSKETTFQRAKNELAEDVSFKEWCLLVAKNPKYASFAGKYAEAIEAVEPYTTRDYRKPASKRHFILEVGPTNSGKTYSGMQALIASKSGVYLGPLRLLAMEAAETMNAAGCPCSLLTGEEHNIVEDANHIASTVEMLDREASYETAVIDECQQIQSHERGMSWTRAITSVNAETVYLMLAPEAEDIITGLLDGMGEDYTVNHHDRLVPLEMCGVASYPNGIKQGDALIVFSRKSVQEYANDLKRKGIKASMVYGALPYDVRKEEVRKFMEGETDVVVATDAIGMGLNLPVKRVVFMETEKFDGHTKRPLTSDEVKQIAGRAGRYGKYEIGYVTATTKAKRELIEKKMYETIIPVSDIRMDFPEDLIRSSIPMCLTMRAWAMDSLPAPYVKRDVSTLVELARLVEDINDNHFVRSAIEIPFKTNDRFCRLEEIWERSVRLAWHGADVPLFLIEIHKNDRMERLEDAAKTADLAYGLAKRYGTPEALEQVEEERAKISRYMIGKLAAETNSGSTSAKQPKKKDKRKAQASYGGGGQNNKRFLREVARMSASSTWSIEDSDY